MSQSKRDDLRKMKKRGVPMPKHCWQCGTVHYPEAKACGRCGSELHATERPPAPTPGPASPMKMWQTAQDKRIAELEAERDQLAADYAEIQADRDKLQTELFNMRKERDALQQENAKLHNQLNDAEQRIVAEQRWSTDQLRGVRADAILRAAYFFEPARDIDVEALKAYADKVRHGGAR